MQNGKISVSSNALKLGLTLGVGIGLVGNAGAAEAATGAPGVVQAADMPAPDSMCGWYWGKTRFGRKVLKRNEDRRKVPNACKNALN